MDIRKTLKAACAVWLACMIFCGCVLVLPAGAQADGGNWTCPNCGRENTSEMNFCGGCRTPKPEAQVADSELINGWICSGCGQICPLEDSFCTNCGTDHLDTDHGALLLHRPTLGAFSYAPCEIVQVPFSDGAMEENNWYYVYTAPIAGRYCFWLQGQDSGFEGWLELFETDGHILEDQTFSVNRPNTWHLFKAGQQFKVRVRIRRDSESPLILCIGVPREVPEIQAPCVIADSIDYVYQDNVYLFQPTISGEYVLQITEMMNGQSLNLAVQDELGYTLESSFMGSDMNDYLHFEVEAGKKYYIHAGRYENNGAYRLSLFCPNQTVSINGAAAVGDHIYYVRQRNRYTFTAPVTANYTFSIGYTAEGNSFNVQVCDSLEHGLSSGSSTGCIAALEAGQTYIIYVSQSRGTGAYTLLIENDYVEPVPEPERTAEEMALIGTTVQFGAFEQDNDTENGAERIEWIVLDAWGGRALLISRAALMAMAYQAAGGDADWETSTVREWLNGEFFSTAFSSTEQSAILLSEVDNGESQGYSGWSTSGGNNTQDRVFLLSLQEAETYFSGDEAALCAPTEYAAAQGAWFIDDDLIYYPYEVDGRLTGMWWLRSPGKYQDWAMCICESGAWQDDRADRNSIGVRPVIWVDLSQISF